MWTRHDRAGQPGAPLTSHSFDKNLKAYAKRAGVEDARIHRTRHTFARIVHEESGSLIEVQDALDHKDLGTTGVYIDRLVVKRDKNSTKIAGRIKRDGVTRREKIKIVDDSRGERRHPGGRVETTRSSTSILDEGL